MSKEYIEREVISEGIRKYYYKNPPNSSYQEGFDYGLDKAQRVILNAPVADVAEVRHGRWIRKEDDICYWYECSECGEKLAKTQWGNDYFSAYCPNCGTLMDKEEPNEL